MNVSNPFAPPQAELRARDRTGRVWRRGRVLCFDRNASLPDRCLKCNEPTRHRLERTLYWHTPWLYILVLPGILIYAIVALFVRKTARVSIGLCDRHRRNRLALIWGGLLLSLIAIAACTASNDAALMGTSMLLMLTGIIVAIVGSQTVTPAFIDDRIVRLRGAGEKFLAEIPESPE